MDHCTVTADEKNNFELRVFTPHHRHENDEGETEPLNQIKNNSRIENENKSDVPISIYQKLKQIASIITIEPFLAFYVMGYWITVMATMNLNLDKACRVNLKYADNVCDALQLSEIQNYKSEELETQKLLADMIKWKSILLTVLPVCLLMFIGAWSDKYQKRKVLILLPFAGDLCMNSGMLLNTYFFQELPMEVAGITEVIFIALTGGLYTMFLGSFSYISAISSVETRTFRLGLVSLAFTICQPLGLTLSGVLLKLIGYYGVFTLAACINIASLIYGCITIKEPVINRQVEKIDGCCGFLRAFFDFKQLKQTFIIILQKGNNHRRLRVILLLICTTLVFGINQAEFSFLYLFARFRYNWDPVQITIYSSYYIIVHFVGTLIALSFFSRYLGWDDNIVGIIATLSKMSSTVIYIFGSEAWMMYTVPFFEIFKGASFVVIKSVGSKLVAVDDVGKMYAISGLVEAIVPMLFDPFFAHFYIKTVNTVPGAVFGLGSALSIIVIFIFLEVLQKSHWAETIQPSSQTEIHLSEIAAILAAK